MANVTVFLLNGTTTWTVPANFGSLVSVECIGAGGSGNFRTSLGSLAHGGAGAYAKITSTSTTLTPGVTSINVGVGAGGAGISVVATEGNIGGDTWWNATSAANAVTLGSGVACMAKGAAATTVGVGGVGGLASGSVGTTKSNGGSGFGGGTGGGGGAAGPSGAGSNGISTAGGAADNSTVAAPTASANGNSGTEFDASHGCGTGAFSTVAGTGFTGGTYGGGGTAISAAGTSGPGGNGLLVIVYAPIPLLSKLIINQAVKRAAFW